MTRGRKTLAIVAGVPAALMLSVAAGYDYVRGAAFVIQAAGMQGSARTVAEWTTTDLVESETEIPTRSGSVRGRVYRPASTNGPATLLVPGVHAGGIDEPRLIQFARDVASMGRIVVTAELPDLKRYSITPRSTDIIEDAAFWLSERSGYAPDQSNRHDGDQFCRRALDRRGVASSAPRSGGVRDVVRRPRRLAADTPVSLHRRPAGRIVPAAARLRDRNHPSRRRRPRRSRAAGTAAARRDPGVPPRLPRRHDRQDTGEGGVRHARANLRQGWTNQRGR